MIIVSGASRGIGKEISERLANKGEKVIGLARSIDGLDIEAYKCDVGNYLSVKDVARQIKQKKSLLKHL